MMATAATAATAVAALAAAAAATTVRLALYKGNVFFLFFVLPLPLSWVDEKRSRTYIIYYIYIRFIPYSQPPITYRAVRLFRIR